MNQFSLKNDEVMICGCGESKFEIGLDGETVMCVMCKSMFKLGQHLFSGCAESCGMLYPYVLEVTGNPQEPKDWIWREDNGSQDWSQLKSATDGCGENLR